MTLLYVARHAEQDRTPGAGPDSGITKRGEEQARSLGERLRNVRFDGIHHSPRTRAVETARAVAESFPTVPVLRSPPLTDRTPFPTPANEGLYRAEDLLWMSGIPVDERDPDGTQISSALRHFARLPGQHLLITHAFVVGAFVREVLDAPAWRWLGLDSSNCGLTIIRALPDQPLALLAYNETGHLPTQ